MPDVRCRFCRKVFHAKPSWIAYGHAKYCSQECQFRARRKGKVVQCFICKKNAYKPPKALKNSKSGKYFCSKSCQTVWRNTMVFVGSRHSNWKNGEHVEYRNIMAKNKVRPICKICKKKDKRVLCVHHKDRNRKNNTISNLTWLCYNCHHLVHNHKVSV
jgi:hypothetical protein